MLDSCETSTDAELVADAKGGVSAAFEQLVRRYQGPLLRYVSRSLGRHDAEDVTQDAFVQAYLHLPKYDPRWAFKTWLFVIAQRLTIDRLRRRRAVRKVDDADITRPDEANPVEAADAAGRLWAVARATLGDEAYRALWLFYVEDLPAADIARVLGRSWVWVRTSLHRSRAKLRPHLTGHVEGGFRVTPATD
jgi:RNA polymerase sigma-70 factor (ECF subfamily)